MALQARKPTGVPATYDDIVSLPEHMIGEIIEGELVVSPRPAFPHALAGSAISQDLGPFARRTGGPRGPGGWWIIFEPELHLGRHVLVPDLAGWRHERMPEWPDAPWTELAPDWVCEVMSPSSGRRDRLHKARIYRQFGVQWLWLVEPLQQTVEVWHGHGDTWEVIGGWEADDAEARIPPFEAVAMELGRWWGGRVAP